MEKLGVENIEINDLYSIDSDTLRALQPIHGLIFLFKYSKLDREFATSNQPITGEYEGNYLDKGIFLLTKQSKMHVPRKLCSIYCSIYKMCHLVRN